MSFPNSNRKSQAVAFSRASMRRAFRWWLLGMVGFGLLQDVPNAQVVISEFMASNSQTLRDEDREFSDWIELYNAGAESVNLLDWSLTDNSERLTKWRFPAVTLGPGECLVIFASEKDRTDPSAELHTNFKLSSDGEYLALVRPDGATIAHEFRPTYPSQLSDTAYGYPGSDPSIGAPRYLRSPTPGTVNEPPGDDLGPLIGEAAHQPKVPEENQDLVVTVLVGAALGPVAEVVLHSRIMFEEEVRTPMRDDGLHGDGGPADGVFGAIIPAGSADPGEMIRYRITASDTSGRTSRWPPNPDPRNSPRYAGTIVNDPEVRSALPVIHWFIQSPRSADTESGARCAVFFAGELYDNVGVNLHGQSSSGFPKKSYDFDFHRGHLFRFDPELEPVEDFNLLTTYPDKSHMRNLLAYETYRDAGAGYHIAFPVRVEQNGEFFSDAHFVEDADETFLERLGLDPRGALYKMYNRLDSATSDVEKKTRTHEGNADLQALISGLRRAGQARTRFLFDNVDIPAMVNYLAAMIITGGVDCCHKNYYAYRDSEGTGEWRYLPWDVDLTFGRDWNSTDTYFDDRLHSSNSLFVGGNNALISALYNTAAFRQMYLRRVRTLMDELLQPPDTPPEELKFERRIRELSELIAPDAALDFDKWPTWGQRQTLAQAVSLLTNQYFPARRRFLYQLRDVPPAQPEGLGVVISSVDFYPASGNQDEEYIEITNTNTIALDLTGWRVSGAVEHAFSPGTVLPTGGSIYLSPNVNAFRARETGPGGDQGLFVQGNYRGRLSARGGRIVVYDPTGREAGTLDYAGAPTLAQRHLRITEIMYNPMPPPAGSGFVAGDFEYVRVTNHGDVPIAISEVRFTDGIELDGAVQGGGQLMMPGESLYVVKNPDAFRARYGGGFKIAGPYTGSLDNQGEILRLEDSHGEEVLRFRYDPDWHPATDGGGRALEAVDWNAPWDAWTKKPQWRPGATIGGSPAGGPPGLEDWRALHFTEAELADPEIGGDRADPDGDGHDNFAEFVSGTDPRNPESRFQVEQVELEADDSGNATLVIRFAAAAGRTYTIQFSESVQGGGWRKFADFPAQAEPRVIEASAPLNGSGKGLYYRVVTPQQP